MRDLHLEVTVRRSASLGGLTKTPSNADLWKRRPELGTPSPPRSPNSPSQYYQTSFEDAYCDVAKQRNLRKLEQLFIEADTDNSGEMSLDEFRTALRKPWIQKTFSALGVQPHQGELLFKSMAKERSNNGELSIQAFMEGLTAICGASIDGTGRELDIQMLRPTRAAKLMRADSPASLGRTLSPALLGRTSGDNSPTSLGRSAGIKTSPSSPSQTRTRTQSPAHLGPVHLLPDMTIQRAFVHSATAKAFLPAACNATKCVRTPNRIAGQGQGQSQAARDPR